MPKSFIQCTKFSQMTTIFSGNNHSNNNNNINTMSRLREDPIHKNTLVSDPIDIAIIVTLLPKFEFYQSVYRIKPGYICMYDFLSFDLFITLL